MLRKMLMKCISNWSSSMESADTMRASTPPMKLETGKNNETNLYEVYWGPFLISAIECESKKDCIQILKRRSGKVWADAHRYPKGMISIVKKL